MLLLPLLLALPLVAVLARVKPESTPLPSPAPQKSQTPKKLGTNTTGKYVVRKSTGRPHLRLEVSASSSTAAAHSNKKEPPLSTLPLTSSSCFCCGCWAYHNELSSPPGGEGNAAEGAEDGVLCSLPETSSPLPDASEVVENTPPAEEGIAAEAAAGSSRPRHASPMQCRSRRSCQDRLGRVWHQWR